MNNLEKDRIRRNNMEKVDIFKLDHRFGCVRVNCGNSLEHEIEKLKEVYYALKEGCKVATECVSKDGNRRFDFINFDTGIVKEIETGKSYDKGDGSVAVKI